jgi:HK97 family phage prohead protease
MKTAREARKSCAMSLKATNDETGQFTALVSVFGVVDSYDEVVMPGAFTSSLERFGDDPIPLMWNHQWGALGAHLGGATGVQTDEGLEITGQFDMDDPDAVKAYRLLKSKRIREFSIGGFEPAEGIRREKLDGRDVWAVYEFELVEVSLVLRGANPETRLIDVKSAGELVAARDADDLAATNAAEGGADTTTGDAAQADASAATDDPPADEDHPTDAEPDPGDADEATEKSAAFTQAQQRASALLDLIT